MSGCVVTTESGVGVAVALVSMASSHSVALLRSFQLMVIEEAVLLVLMKLLGREQEGASPRWKSST